MWVLILSLFIVLYGMPKAIWKQNGKQDESTLTTTSIQEEQIATEGRTVFPYGLSSYPAEAYNHHLDKQEEKVRGSTKFGLTSAMKEIRSGYPVLGQFFRDDSLGRKMNTFTSLVQVPGLISQLPRYTKANLPPSLNTSAIARVTDNVRGTWTYSGTQWVKLFPYVNLADFEPIGDGKVDDTTSVQNWLNAVQASGMAGYVPPGLYRITRQLTVKLTNDQAFSLIGGGAISVRSKKGVQFFLGANLASATTPMLKIDGNSQAARVAIIGIAFIGRGFRGSGVQIMNSTDNTHIERVVIKDFDASPMAIGLDLDSLLGFTIISTRIEQAGIALRIGGSLSGQGMILSSWISSFSTAGIRLTGNASQIRIVGNAISSTNQKGIEVTRASRGGTHKLIIIGNNFENCRPAIVSSSDSVNDSIIEANVVNFSVSSGTHYGFDFATLGNSSVRYNSFDIPVTGGTGIGLRITKSKTNLLGPNRFVGKGNTPYSIPGNAASLWGIDSVGTASRVAYIDSSSDSGIFTGPTFELASNKIKGLTNFRAGVLLIRSATSGALFMVSSNAVTKISDPDNVFTTSKGSAGKTNVYWDVNDGRVEIENETGATKTVQALFLGSP